MDPNRLWDSSNPLIEECKCRWKCAPLTMGLHKQVPPVSAVKGALARASKVPFSTSDVSYQPCSKSRLHSPELFQESVPPAGVCRAPLWPGHALCVPPRSRGRHTSSYHAQQMPCNTLTCHHLATPWTSHCRHYPDPQTFDMCTLCFSPFWALSWSVQADGMV